MRSRAAVSPRAILEPIARVSYLVTQLRAPSLNSSRRKKYDKQEQGRTGEKVKPFVKRGSRLDTSPASHCDQHKGQHRRCAGLAHGTGGIRGPTSAQQLASASARKVRTARERASRMHGTHSTAPAQSRSTRSEGGEGDEEGACRPRSLTGLRSTEVAGVRRTYAVDGNSCHDTADGNFTSPSDPRPPPVVQLP